MLIIPYEIPWDKEFLSLIEVFFDKNTCVEWANTLMQDYWE